MYVGFTDSVNVIFFQMCALPPISYDVYGISYGPVCTMLRYVAVHTRY
jgi:hypothetical protein